MKLNYQHIILNKNIFVSNLLFFEAQKNLAGATADMAPASKAPDLWKHILKKLINLLTLKSPAKVKIKSFEGKL